MTRFYVYLLSSFYIGVRSFVKSTGFLFLFPPIRLLVFPVFPVRAETFFTHVASGIEPDVRRKRFNVHARPHKS